MIKLMFWLLCAFGFFVGVVVPVYRHESFVVGTLAGLVMTAHLIELMADELGDYLKRRQQAAERARTFEMGGRG